MKRVKTLPKAIVGEKNKRSKQDDHTLGIIQFKSSMMMMIIIILIKWQFDLIWFVSSKKKKKTLCLWMCQNDRNSLIVKQKIQTNKNALNLNQTK